jgi:hypothetical protein
VDAAAASDEIWIKQGTYALTAPITVPKIVSLYGGFGGTEQAREDRDWITNPTVIDGQGAAVCFIV